MCMSILYVGPYMRLDIVMFQSTYLSTGSRYQRAQSYTQESFFLFFSLMKLQGKRCPAASSMKGQTTNYTIYVCSSFRHLASI